MGRSARSTWNRNSCDYLARLTPGRVASSAAAETTKEGVPHRTGSSPPRMGQSTVHQHGMPWVMPHGRASQRNAHTIQRACTTSACFTIAAMMSTSESELRCAARAGVCRGLARIADADGAAAAVGMISAIGLTIGSPAGVP